MNCRKMKEGIVKGISTQRPYEQGQAAGRVLAKSLVSEDIPKYIAVQPYLIRENQLKQAWQNIFLKSYQWSWNSACLDVV